MIETSTVVPAAAERTRVRVPMRFADGYATTADVVTFDGLVDGREHLLLGLGDWRAALDRAADGGAAPLVRPHSECLTGDVFGSERCDCGPQLREAVERIAAEGGGIKASVRLTREATEDELVADGFVEGDLEAKWA